MYSQLVNCVRILHFNNFILRNVPRYTRYFTLYYLSISILENGATYARDKAEKDTTNFLLVR